MSFFCLLWVPLFYLFRRAFISDNRDGIAWALPLGIAGAILQWFTGAFITPGGFGFFCWLSGFIDVVCLPVLAPLAVCLLLIALKVLPGDADIAGFILLCLIPHSIIRSIQWSSPGLPVMLILVPVLWTALGTGLSFFISCARIYPRWYVVISSALAIAVMPAVIATAWWAFYGQRALIGSLCLIAGLTPLLIRTVLDIVKKQRVESGE